MIFKHMSLLLNNYVVVALLGEYKGIYYEKNMKVDGNVLQYCIHNFKKICEKVTCLIDLC